MRLSSDEGPDFEPCGHIGRLKLKSEFERCWPWLEESLKFGAYQHYGHLWPTHNKEHVWASIDANRAYLWPGLNCVILTEILVAATGLRSHNTWLVGGDLDEIVKMTPTIEAWGRANGCQRQLGTGRRGWVKVLDGYTEYAVRRSKDLLA